MVTDNNVKPGAPAVPEDTEAAFRSLCAEHGPALLGLTTVAQHLAASVDKTGLRAAIATLPGPQQQALTEVQYRDRSAAETARILQTPVGTVRSRVFDGLRALRRTLAAHDAVA